MKSLIATCLIFICVWQVTCLSVNSLCPNGLGSTIVKKIVLAIDVSASMESQEKLKEVRSVLEEWIMHQIPCPTQLGIVKFSSSARTLSNLTEVNNESRSELVAKIPTRARGETCISCGLKEAKKVFGSGNNSRDSSVIVLLTDANDSELDLDSEFVRFMEASHVQVVVVIISNDMEILQDIEKLTELTHGFTRYIRNEDVFKGLLEVLTKVETQILNNTSITDITEETTTSIQILNDTSSSTVSTTFNSNETFIETIGTPSEDTPINQFTNNKSTISMQEYNDTSTLTVSTTYNSSGNDIETSVTPSEDAAINQFTNNKTIISMSSTSMTSSLNISSAITSPASTVMPAVESISPLWYLGAGALIASLIFIIILSWQCFKKCNKRPFASHGSYAPVELRRGVHGDQVRINHALRPSADYS